MSNEIYNAFIEAGLTKEANMLSTTKEVEGRIRVVPAIGHYIALVDSLPKHFLGDKIWGEPDLSLDTPAVIEVRFRNLAMRKITEYTAKLLQTEKDTQKLEKIKGLINKLETNPQIQIRMHPITNIPIMEIK